MNRRTFIKSAILTVGGMCAARISQGASPAQTIPVYILQASSAKEPTVPALNHYQNKFYPSDAAAISRLPHRGCKYIIAVKELRVPSGVTKEILFEKRKDLDLRVQHDQKHLQKIGIDVLDIQQQLFV